MCPEQCLGLINPHYWGKTLLRTVSSMSWIMGFFSLASGSDIHYFWFCGAQGTVASNSFPCVGLLSYTYVLSSQLTSWGRPSACPQRFLSLQLVLPLIVSWEFWLLWFSQILISVSSDCGVNWSAPGFFCSRAMSGNSWLCINLGHSFIFLRSLFFVSF